MREATKPAGKTRDKAKSEPAGNLLSLDRAITLLKAVAASADGLRLTDAANVAALSPSTTHRILSALVEHHLLRLPVGTRKYLPGAELYRLGLAAARHFSLVDLARPSLLSLAERTQDTLSLSIIDGGEALCLDRVVGSYPIKTMALEIGERRPLGVGAGSLALLAALPTAEWQAVVKDDSARIARYADFSAAALGRWVDESARRGYAYSPERVLAGMSAVGVAIRDAEGWPIGSISLSGVAPRVRGERLKEIIAMLQHECSQVAKAVAVLRLGVP